MKRTLKHIAMAGAAISIWSQTVSAQSPEEIGRTVAERADQEDNGWHDDASSMRMILRNSGGQESIRELRRQALESTDDERGDKSIIVFEAPRDIQGTALLSHTRILEADDQWLYLPALARVKRISSSNKSGPFVGSEFAYEDLVSQEVGKYDYRWVRDEACGDLDCAVVERYPLYEASGYTKQVVWWDKNEYRIQRIDFYDRKDTLLKTLTYHSYNEYDGGFWRPDRMEMINHQNGKTTDLVFQEWTLGAGVSENDFTASRLRRAR